MYLAMLFTNWASVSLNDGGNGSDGDSPLSAQFGPVNFWIKVISGWISILLYIWSLYAPAIFPDREF